MDIKNLPNDISELKEIVLNLSSEVDALKIKNQDLLDQLQKIKRLKFDSSSERNSGKELGLFNEIEEVVADSSETNSDIDEVDTERKRKKKRKHINPDLPRVEEYLDLTDEEKICPHDGTVLVKIGEDISEKLEIIPAKVYVRKIIRPKYSCPCCKEGVHKNKKDDSILPGTMATASLLSFIIVSKFADALPLCRQEKIFSRIELSLTRATMGNWLIKLSEKLTPLYNLLQEKLLDSFYLQMDETTVQVLVETDKSAKSKSYMWVRYKPGENPIVLYDYYPTRSSIVPVELLSGFKGALQVDGYDGYSRVVEDQELKRLGCMDHARRKFYDASKTSSGKNIGSKGLSFLKKLYKIEKKIKELSREEKKEARQRDSLPILENINI